MPEQFDIAVVGAGAAGLMAAIWAARTARGRKEPPRVVALDGAKALGVKILVAGGGRCNVTHHAVDESAYAGSSRHAIKKVLRGFGVARTVEFFGDLGVELKREPTGKLFPTTDRARTVLEALLAAAAEAGVVVRHPWRVEAVVASDGGFALRRHEGDGATDSITARRVILATGGKSLPKSGSDGHGYELMRSLGHSLTPRVFPALVPLTLPPSHPLCSLSGIAVPATLHLRSSTGKRLVSFTNSTLLTHFGLSGPSVLDISRYYIDQRAADPGATLVINFLPEQTPEAMDAALLALNASSPARLLSLPPHSLPDRLARCLCGIAGVDPAAPGHSLTRDKRRALVDAVTQLRLPITGDRGFVHAEVTAGGVPLSEIHLDTMESRICPGLHLCGEILDVDGRIGGFNFQWAWASGYAAGVGAAGSPAAARLAP
ncbi:MAG: aminoacetone oxidase family FAD-binding enzyme [Phycisphaeraceae bacterium]|nr:aminoacetone oxidase family FAD-binding enzyme [Phycisphaeraceae bacterium]